MLSVLVLQVPYERAWAWQRALVRRRLAALDAGEAGCDALLLLQHPPVLTLGTGSSLAPLRFDPAAPPLPLHRTERGGEATYHGPGQLVVYPVLHLREHTADLHWYMRSLEEVALRTLSALGLPGGRRVPGLTGAWLDGHKVAACGVRCRRWVTWHGLALNVAPDLGHFRHIVPCGIADRPVGSVRLLLPPGAPLSGVGDAELLGAAREALLGAFGEVFGRGFQAGGGAGALDALAESLGGPLS